MGDKELREITIAAIETAQAVVNDSGEIGRDKANRFLLKLKEELDGLLEPEAANVTDADTRPLSEAGRRVRSSRLNQTRDMIQRARGLIDGLQDFVRWADYTDEDLADSEVTRGLYLVEPHGAMIADGRKRAIVKARRLDLEGEWVLVSGRQAYGIVGLGAPERVNAKDFDGRFDEHRVSTREREKWWATYEHLWLYPVASMKAYKSPKPVVLPQGVQTIIQQVEYKDADRETRLLRKLADLPDMFVWIPNFASLTGSQIYAEDGREPNDVDVVLRAQNKDGSFYVTDDGAKAEVSVDASFALKLERLLSDKLGAERVQYVNNAYGPNWRSLPLYDLCLVRKPELKYAGVDESEFADQQYKAKAGVSTQVSNVAPTTTGEADSVKEKTVQAGAHGVQREDDSVECLPDEPSCSATADKARQTNTDLYPDESKKLRFVSQNHYRGKSCHLDMRFEYKRGGDNWLRGFTVTHQIADAIKEPVTTMKAAKAADAKPGNWKMDLKTGLIKPREMRGGTVRRGDLLALPKAAEIPKGWLDEEGVTEKPDPSEKPPVGATAQYPGVFTILQKGQVEWGVQKPAAKEFFLDGSRWKGRWIFRLIKRKEALPPGKEEEDARTGTYLVLMQPEDQTPNVLAAKTVKDGWLPPKGVSCLPKRIRNGLPEKYHYWKMDTKEALAARRQLVEDWEKLGGPKLTKAKSAEFALMRRNFSGPAVVRFGSSTVVHDLFIQDGETWRLELKDDPLKGETAAMSVKSGRAMTNKVFEMDVGDTIELEPGQPGNPTKDTPAKLTLVDKGTTQELSKEAEYCKYEFGGKKLKGAWLIKAEDSTEGLWLMSRSGGPRLKTFKGEDGRDWLLLWTVNAFRDRDKEIFATPALEDHADRHEDDEIKGEFQFWHLPGTKFGDILWQGTSGRFLVEMGPFDDTDMGRVFQKFFESCSDGHPVIAPDGWGASHKYAYNPEDKKDGVYHWFEKEESSVLPAHEAANPYNPKMEVFSMNKKQREDLAIIGDEVGVGGDELVKMVEQIGETRTKELEANGVDYKAKNDFAERLRDIADKLTEEQGKNTLLKLVDEMEKAHPASGAETNEGTKDLKSIAAKLATLAKKVGGDAEKQLVAIAKELEGYAAKPGSSYPEPEEKVSKAREADLTELDSGAVVGLAPESTKAVDDVRAPLGVYVKIVEPGWGNKRDNNYYSAEMLRRDAHVFEGSKMFATDHVNEEKNVRNEVSIMEKAPVFFTSGGAPVGLARIFDPDFAEATRNRIKSGHLESLRCSLYAKGKVREGFERDGRKGNLVESISPDPKPDVDWVSRSGAGGHATEVLGGDVVESALAETNLPAFVRDMLVGREYADSDELSKAVTSATAQVKSLTGSGQVFGQGQSDALEEKGMSDEDYDNEYRRIAERHGLTMSVVKEA